MIFCFQAEDGIRDIGVTGVQTCALPICTQAAKDIVDDLTPYDNSYEVRLHLKESNEALKLIQLKGEPPFEGVYDVRESINRVEKGITLLPGQLLKIANLLRCARRFRSEEHTSELQSRQYLVCRLLLEKKKYTL